MKEVRTSVTIAAPVEMVWRVLTDFDTYSQWSPFIRSVSGKLSVGEKLAFAVATGPEAIRSAKARVLRVDENRCLSWGGGLPLGLFRAEHSFIIEPAAAGVVVHDVEQFRGLLAGFLIREDRIRAQHKAFEAFDNALRVRAEALAESMEKLMEDSMEEYQA